MDARPGRERIGVVWLVVLALAALGGLGYVLATQSPDVDATKPILYTTVLVLLALTFVLNIAAILVRARVRRVSGLVHG